MCKVFAPRNARRVKPSHRTLCSQSHTIFLILCSSRCPHSLDICRNVAVHPRGNIVYLKDAEGISNHPFNNLSTLTSCFVTILHSANFQRVRLLQGDLLSYVNTMYYSSIVVCSHGAASQACRASKSGMARVLSSSSEQCRSSLDPSCGLARRLRRPPDSHPTGYQSNSRCRRLSAIEINVLFLSFPPHYNGNRDYPRRR